MSSRLGPLLQTLREADVFYSSLGGIIGYQAKCLELIHNKQNADPTNAEANQDDIQAGFLHGLILEKKNLNFSNQKP